MALPSVISDANKVPGIYTLVSLGVGPRSNGDSPRIVALVGNMLSTGTATVGVEYDIFSAEDAIPLFGAGSELHMMAAAALTAWSGVSIKCMAITESAGANASGTIVCAGPATANGTVGVSVLGEEIQVAVSSGDSATVIGAAVAAAITAKTNWPVTATASTGTVTVTAKNKGPRGNFLAVRARVLTYTGVAVTPPSSGFLTGGTTSDDPQPALDTLATVQRRYLVSPYSDATQLAKFKSHLDAQDDPSIGHRRQCIWGSIDTLAGTTTLATGLNFPRMQSAWHYLADQPPSVLAAALAARRAARESSGPTGTGYNFDGEILPGIKPAFLASSRPNNAQLQSALNNGITPLLAADDGSVSVVRSITCKSRDANSNPDYRVLDTTKVSVTDEVADRVELVMGDRFVSFSASQEPPDGTTAGPGVLTPSMLRDVIYEVNVQAEADRLLESGTAEANKDKILVELSTTAQGRFNYVNPIDVIEGAHQFCGEIRQVG